MNEDFLPDASRVFVVTEKRNAVRIQMVHGLMNVRSLKCNVMNACLTGCKKSVQKTAGCCGRNDLQPGQVPQGEKFPKKFC